MHPDADEKFCISDPDGSMHLAKSLSLLKQYYQSRRIDWPYAN